MGQYFKIINVSKKQYIDINDLGENNKFSGIGYGLNSIALGRLLTSHGETDDEWGKTYCHTGNQELYAGYWAGDRIIIAGDYDLADTNSIKTSCQSDSFRNLYDMVNEDSEYKDVTNQVIKWLAKSEDISEILAQRAHQNKELLRKLSQIVFIDKNELLRRNLEKVIGKDWTKIIKE